MSCSLASTNIPRDAVPVPTGRGQGSKGGRLVSSLCRSLDPVPPGRRRSPSCFPSFSYLKKKQNSPHSSHVKCHLVCHQTISLQSHNDPCSKKKKKKENLALHPIPTQRANLWKSLGPTRSNSHAEEQWEAGRPEPTQDKEGGSMKFKGLKKCQSNTSTV